MNSGSEMSQSWEKYFSSVKLRSYVEQECHLLSRATENLRFDAEELGLERTAYDAVLDV